MIFKVQNHLVKVILETAILRLSEQGGGESSEDTIRKLDKLIQALTDNP